MSMGMMDGLSSKYDKEKVKRVSPAMVSVPIVASIRPKQAETIP